MKLWAAALALTCWVTGASAQAPRAIPPGFVPEGFQTYGFQEVGPLWGGFVARKNGGEGFSVGVQANGWSNSGLGSVWGLAAEASCVGGSLDYCIAVEAGVIATNPNNRRRKIAVHAAIGCEADALPCTSPGSNADSVAIWITGQPKIGWTSGIKFSPESLMAGTNMRRPDVVRPPAVLDLEDIPMQTLRQWDLIRLPDGMAIRFDGEKLVVVRGLPY